MPSTPLFPKGRAPIAASSSLPASESWLAALIIFFSATQLGRHFWPASAMISGVRVDYLSPTVYFLDPLIVVYLISRATKGGRTLLVSFVPILLTNLFFSGNPLATLSWSLHLLLYSAFVFSLSSTLLSFLSSPLSLAIFSQVTLALVQLALGHSLQGFFYWLGERAVSVGAPTVATASFFGHTLLRAYGTFSHPNALAGWLTIACLIVLQPKRSAGEGQTPWLPTVTICLASLGVLATGSRAAAASLFGLVIPFYYLRSWRPRLTYFVFLLTASCLLLPSGFAGRSLDLSASSRLALQNVSFSLLRAAPIFGTGAEGSISAAAPLARPLGLLSLQPDHDSFTLFLSWFGLFGALALILSSIQPPYNRYSFYKLYKSYIPLLPLLFFDHYLLTSPQGLFILLLYLRTLLVPAV